MPGGVGILVPEPVTEGCDAEYIAKLASFDPAWIVQTQLKHVTEAVSAIRAKQRAPTALGETLWLWERDVRGGVFRDARAPFSLGERRRKRFRAGKRDFLRLYRPFIGWRRVAT